MPNNRKSGQKVSPYLCVAIALAVVAILLLVVILVVAFSEPGESPGGDSSEAPTFHESSDATEEPSREDPSQGDTSGSTEDPDASSRPSDESIDDGSTDPTESVDVSVEPPVSGAGSLEQPAPTVAYEKRIGKAYSIDMTEWEQYVSPEDPMEYVILVDATHTLAADYVPEDLVWIKDMREGRPEYYSKMRSCAEMALEAFLEEGRQYGIDDVKVSNGYRSYSIQRDLFESYKNEERARHPDYTEEEIEALVLTYSLRPGTSEHQSGLCVDMHNQRETNMSFAGTEAAIWLEKNCYRFGFILRYPEDKEDITTVMFEPWHFRFVGREAATEMHDLGICLEEYCAYKGIA